MGDHAAILSGPILGISEASLGLLRFAWRCRSPDALGG
jgi:hypothetical protein